MATSELDNPSPDLLLSLPHSLMVNMVLPQLSAKELVRLRIAMKDQLPCLLEDAVWRPRLLDRGWEPPESEADGASMRAYSDRQRVLCVECQQPTRHKFKLLGCRLCTACETRHPRYALVTGLEAQQRYGLPAVVLSQLPWVQSCGVRLWLRDAVLRHVQGSDSSESDSGSEDSCVEDAGSPVEEGPEKLEEDGQETAGKVDEDEEEGAGKLVQDEPAGPSDPRAAQKALRKAQKKQAKLDQKAKREEKAAGLLTTKMRRALTRSGGAQGSYGMAEGAGGGGGKRSGGGGGNKQRRNKAAQGDASGSSPPLLGSSPKFTPNSRRGSKVKSPWLAEREQLMREYGEFGLSGLVLAE